MEHGASSRDVGSSQSKVGLKGAKLGKGCSPGQQHLLPRPNTVGTSQAFTDSKARGRRSPISGPTLLVPIFLDSHFPTCDGPACTSELG